MKVRMQGSGFGPATESQDIRSVVVYDDYDQPVFALQRTGEGQIVSVSAGEPGFDKMLRAMGIGLNAQVIRTSDKESANVAS